MRPRIGITTSVLDGQQQLDLRYVRAVTRAGGFPVPVPSVPDDLLEALAGELDGLLVTGGPAVDEGLIGALPADLATADPERRRVDRCVLEAMLRRRRPVLGVCFGMQLLNAVRGGTIYADVEQQVEGSLVHSEKRGGGTHRVDIVPRTLSAEVMGTTAADVNTRHIQAVAEPGSGVRVTGVAPDGVVEIIELEDRPAIGVQFHPERAPGEIPSLFEWLVRTAAE